MPKISQMHPTRDQVSRNPPSSADEATISRISRRQFARHAAVAAAALVPSTIFALPEISSLAGPSSVAGAQAAKSGLMPAQEQEVEARLANIVRKFGDRLSEDQRQHLRRILTYNERLLASIRKFPLENSDPPASVLKLAVGPESADSSPASLISPPSRGRPVARKVEAS